MKDEINSNREFSGRFQIRINPVLHKKLFDLSNGMNCSINDVLELSADYALSRADFLSYLDDYLHGAVMIVENNAPVAHLVRRNVISFSYVNRQKISIEIKIKRGSVWQQAKIIADLNQNPKLVDRLNEWLNPR